jgi:hypothetical protein
MVNQRKSAEAGEYRQQQTPILRNTRTASRETADIKLLIDMGN